MSTAESTQSVSEQLAGVAPLILERFNTFEDSLVFVARVLGGYEHATSARVVGIDVRGFDMVVIDHRGEHALRLEYETELDDVWKVTDIAYSVIQRARAQSGESGQTSAEREFEALRTTRTWFTEVRAAENVHPRLRKITFGGGDLVDFAPLGPDTFLYVLLPPPGRPDLQITRAFSWDQVPELPEDERPVGAYYTLRAWRPEVAELDMLFVLHDDPGPASSWAATVEPGAEIVLWGPRESWEPPADTEWYLLLADETGLPAVASILESLPPEVRVLVCAEVASLDERIDLQDGDQRTIVWLPRDGKAPGTCADLLDHAVRALELPPGPGYAWGGGESRGMTRVRRYLRDELGWARERVNLVAYWRHPSSPEEE